MALAMIIKNLKYGISRFIEDAMGKGDYWHVRLKPIEDISKSTHIYFLNMTLKSYYPGEMENGIPVFYYNGNVKVLFYTTVINYGLGLLNRYQSDNSMQDEIKNIANWLIETQQEDGSWRYDFIADSHPLSNGKASGMTQGLAISFLLRCIHCGLLEKSSVFTNVQNAVKFMLSDRIVSEHDGNKLIEEYYVPSTSVLNGSIFGLFGLYDYCVEINDLKLFDEYVESLVNLLPKYNLGWWSYYDLSGSINSRFYHQLHIDMMDVLGHLTGRPIFKKYADSWRVGLNFSLIFILMKSMQKLWNIKKIDRNEANKE